MALTQVKTTGIADDAVTGAKIADDTVAEANMANDAISLTELKAGTDGQIITYDASGNPTAVGPGTDGQVLTSTGAGSPPAFENAAGAIGGSTGVDFNDGVKARFGTGNDLEIHHTGGESYIDEVGAGSILIRSDTHVRINKQSAAESMATFNPDGSVELYHNNIKTFETHGNGITVKGPEGGEAIINLQCDEGDDNADKWRIAAFDGADMYFSNYNDGGWEHNIIIKGGGSTELYHNDSKRFETTSAGWKSIDNIKGVWGTGDDLEIYHDGTDSFIKNSTGTFKLYTTHFNVKSADGSEEIMSGDHNGACKLNYDNSTKVQTISTGVNITGGVRLGGNNAANEMDDYEEGTFTPYISTQGGTSNCTYNNRGGQYIKIGRLCYVTMFIDWTGATNHDGFMYFQDLPFTSAANIGSTPNMHNNYGLGMTVHHNLSLSGDAQPFLFLGAGATGSNLVSNSNNNAAVNEGHDNAGKVYVNLTYITA